MALDDAGGEPLADPARKGVVIATGIGGLNTLEDQIWTRLNKGERRVSPFLVPMMMANAGGAAVSMRYGWQGPCETIATRAPPPPTASAMPPVSSSGVDATPCSPVVPSPR